MKNRILFIVGKGLRDPIMTELSLLDENAVYQIEEFTELHEVADIYCQYKDNVDGIITGGHVLNTFLKRRLGEITLPVEMLNRSPSHIYLRILKEIDSHPDLRLDRVFIDYMLPFHRDAALRDFIEEGGIEKSGTEFARWIENASPEELLSLAARIDHSAAQLWERQEIDLVICLYSVTTHYFRARGIPCCLPYPSAPELGMLVRSLNYKIVLQKQRENIAVAAFIMPLDHKDTIPSNIDVLENALLTFRDASHIDFVLSKQEGLVMLFTNMHWMNYLTNFTNTCHLSHYLEAKTGFPLSIGYGLGNDVLQARTRAGKALKESFANKGSYIADGEDNLIGPLNSDSCQSISEVAADELIRISGQCKLSLQTIQKLYTMVHLTKSNHVTSKLLTERFHMTARNANRILKKLVLGGAATESHTQLINHTGHPETVYALHFQ